MPAYAIYLPIKFTFLISTNIKLASTMCFGSCVPSEGEQNTSSQKLHATAKLLYIRSLHSSSHRSSSIGSSFVFGIDVDRRHIINVNSGSD